MKTLKDKKIDIATANHGLSFECYNETDVKEAVKQSQKNNRVWCDTINKVIETLNLTEKEEFDIKTSLDGIMKQNKIEVFGDL